MRRMRRQDVPDTPYVGISVFFNEKEISSFLVGAAVVVFIGLASSRSGMISTRSGHVKAMEMFAYKICTPIMFVNIAATHNFESYDWKFLAACLLAKLITYVFVWTITYFFYKTHRPQRSRLTTAATTSVAMVCTADLSFGIPLTRIIYKSSEYNADPDILSCTLSSILFFAPLSSALVHMNIATVQGSEVSRQRSLVRIAVDYFKLHAANLQLLAVVLGFFIRGFVSWTSLDIRSQVSIVSAIVDMFLLTFPVVSLFVTGTAIDVAKNNEWAFFFAICKVFGVAYMSFCLRMAFGGDVDQHSHRASAAFFYGSLPVSSMMMSALHVDRTSKELVAGLILWSYVLSLPTTFSGISLFGIIENGKHLVQYGLFSLDVVSCPLGLCVFLVIILMGPQYGFGCRAKQLLFICVLCTLTSSVLYCIMSPIYIPSYCESFFKYPHDRLANPHFLVLDTFRETCTLMLVAFDVFLLREVEDSVYEPFQALIAAIICFLVAGVKSWITFPVCPAATRMCGMRTEPLTISQLERHTGFVFYGFLGCFGIFLKLRQFHVIGSTREVVFAEAGEKKLARAWTTKVLVKVLKLITDVNLCFIVMCVFKDVASVLPLGSRIVECVEMWIRWFDHGLLGFTMLILVLERRFCSCAKSRINSFRGVEDSSASGSSDSST
eukprot:TRINITY_DN3098_c2_g1_i1.p1 TRINITY_DN3098_c2_g1~~TRINITY_DN3098_c2_g1_i1.p1  ORF type:complete len:665 (-),score=45.59 TRINITY_DN3098_c2_g1_i1:10-2004(-)